jgi:hypothetical protein
MPNKKRPLTFAEPDVGAILSSDQCEYFYEQADIVSDAAGTGRGLGCFCFDERER